MALLQSMHHITIEAQEANDRLAGLTIKDRLVFDQAFKKNPPEISEYTFTNLYIWNHYYNFHYARLDDMLLLLAMPEHKSWTLFPPVGDGDFLGAARVGFSMLQEQGMEPVMERVSETYVRTYFANQPEFEIALDPDNSDYVYLTEDLINLTGRDYHSKRNHINKFNSLYKGQYVRVKDDQVRQCLKLQEEWCNLRNCDEHAALHAEDLAIRTALENIEHLEFRAGAVIIDGKIQAFSLGEGLNRDTAVVHIEKANPELEGLYQVINQQFALFELKHCKYINREQDLGDSGLRKAKLSYQPHHMENKYRVTWRV